MVFMQLRVFNCEKKNRNEKVSHLKDLHTSQRLSVLLSCQSVNKFENRGIREKHLG